MMNRLLSITIILTILLFTSCSEKAAIPKEGVPITFSSAFELITKAGTAMPEIQAQVVG